MRSRPMHRFDGSFDNRDHDVKEALLNAFNATRGAAYGFRFKNWLDYELHDELLGIATGGQQTMQIVKRYVFGGEECIVPIRKPNSDVELNVNRVFLPSSVDVTTGLISFNANPGDRITVTGTYDVPVMFENDEFSAVINQSDFHTISIQLVEDLSA